MVTINCISCYDVFFSRGVSCCALLCIPSMALKSPPRFFLANSSFSVRWCQMMTAKGASKVGAICFFFFFSLWEIKNNNWRESNVTKKKTLGMLKKKTMNLKAICHLALIVKHLYFLTTLRWWSNSVTPKAKKMEFDWDRNDALMIGSRIIGWRLITFTKLIRL